MKKSLILIGIGGIGFRHFQSLFNCKESFDLYVVDLSEDAIKKAREYADSVKHEFNISYFLNTNDIEPMHFNVAIIATASLPRRSVFENLVDKHAIDYLIFEKFLFPSIEDYEIVENILNEKNINAFVDCPARMYDFYTDIKEENTNCKYFVASMKGSNWGLACNAIHLVDQIAYMSESNTNAIECVGLLEDKIFECKRKGYIEFYGKIIGKVGDKCKFVIECDHLDNGLDFEFITDKGYYYVNEGKGLYVKIDLTNHDNIIIKNIKVPYVSQLTNINVDSLLRGKEINLPSYKVSRPLHESLLKVFVKHMKQINGVDSKICPIT